MKIFGKTYYIISLTIVVFIVSILSYLSFSKKIELQTYDFRLDLFGNCKTLDPRIRIVGIDEESIQRLGSWPLKRSIYAKLINNLSSKGAKAIVFDILFDTPQNPQEDTIFADAVKKAGNVFLAYKFEKTDYAAGPQKVLPRPEFRKSARDLGFININQDPDGKVRGVPLIYEGQTGTDFSLDLQAAAFVLGVKPDTLESFPRKIFLKGKLLPLVYNNKLLINYIPQDKISSQTTPISLINLLDPKINTALIKDGIFLIGATAKGTGGLWDYFSTPNVSQAGVVIHANVLNTILQKKFISPVNQKINFIVILIIVLLMGLVLPKLNAAKGLFLSVIFLVVFTVVNFYLFHIGLWLDWYVPVSSIVFSYAFIQSYQFLRTHKLFRQFVPEAVVDEMLKDESKQKLGGCEQEATILFSDIRGYTNLSEKMSPEEVMKLLNEYHNNMSQIFFKNNGCIFDYQGDAQMVVFGAPKKIKEHAFFAVKTALDMQEAMGNLMAKWKLEDRQLFEIGIGICTGKVAVGLVGAEAHKQYAAIGDATNVAARLQGLSKELKSPILISESTYQKVKDKIIATELESVQLKGKSELLKVYRVEEIKN